MTKPLNYPKKMQERKKKVLLALPLPPPYCGQEKMASIILGSRITKEFNCIHLDTSNKQKSNKDRGRLKWINVSSTLRISKEIFRALSKNRVDIVNLPLSCNTYGFIKYVCTLFPCIIFNVRVVSRIGASHFDKFYASQNKLYRKIIRWGLTKIDCVIVRGKEQKKQFDGIYNGKIEYVYIPSTGIKDCAWEKDYNFKTKEKINVLFLGMVSLSKGAYDLLKAIPKILAKDKRFVFHFVGDIVNKETNITFLPNETLDIYKFIREKQINQFIKVCGHLEGEQKENKWKEADLFICPSYSESGPITVLEAMEHGVPVIATKVGALPELFKHKENILFVDSNSPEEIKDAVLRIISDDQLARNMVTNNYKILEGRLSIKEYEKKMIEIFNNVTELI